MAQVPFSCQTNEPMRQAIVIGCHVCGFGVIRSLALQGFRIVAMHYDAFADFAQSSRYVAERAQVPHPRQHEQAFIDILLRNTGRWGGALILATNDDALIAIAKHKTALAKDYVVPTPQWDVLRPLIGKPETYRLAQACGVPYPQTFSASTIDELEQVREQIPFPCLLKPVLGHLFFSEFHRKNLRAGSFEDLVDKFEKYGSAGHPVFVQEIIPGPDSNLFQYEMYIDSSGATRAGSWKRKLRQNPPGFGVARVAISHDEIPVMREWTERMLNAIGFRGLAHSEFKQDARDGTFKLMEINGRLSRSNWLTAYCGMNLPWIAYQDLAEERPIEAATYERGAYWIELSEDVANTISRHGDEQVSFADYMRPYLAARKTFADISVRDWKPLAKRIGNVLRHALQRARPHQ